MMSVFDDIRGYMKCPFCGKWGDMGAQTEELGCYMFNYKVLEEDWETSTYGKQFRENLPVSPKFPLDKEYGVWKNQAERIEAEATIPIEIHGQLNYVNVTASCSKCGRDFEGKIKIINGKLIGSIYGAIKPL